MNSISYHGMSVHLEEMGGVLIPSLAWEVGWLSGTLEEG